MSTAALISVFQIIEVLGSALTALNLFTSGLYRRYRIFFAYFVFRVPYTATPLILTRTSGLGLSSNFYFYYFIYSEPLIILLYILVVVELYTLVLERYRGVDTLGRWAMYLAVSISAAVSILTLLPKIAPTTPEPSRWQYIEVAAERGVDLALVLFILLILGFLTRYPIPLSRNVVVHTAIYSAFFLSNALGLLLRTLLGHRITGTFNLASTALSAACTIAWWRGLSARGEEVKIHAPELRPDSEERILEQLDLLNATLLRVSQK